MEQQTKELADVRWRCDELEASLANTTSECKEATSELKQARRGSGGERGMCKG